ncbi:hypothetical protein VNO78_32978 [Psophocarpus tetragonolobus]|uniref:Uncharacterized protein n=1 Tax=Psophocarpus tetragonolobus TaxID=3891 RepID=A0AAN9P0A7_PSOTE
MARVHSLKYLLSFTCSITLNVLLVSMLIHNRTWKQNWTQEATAEAEAVSSISCSGHGSAFLDGLLANGKPVCECNMCYGGSDCSQLLPDCMVDADSGNPTFLEPFWVKNAASSAIMIAGWHRLSYEFNDGSLISEELKTHIRKVHESVGNAITDGKYIVFGAGATHLLNAAVHALSTSNNGSSSPTKVVASIPYYPVYKEQTEIFNSEDYKFNGDTSMWKNDNSNSTFIELVTSPNNPDGQTKKAVLQGQFVKTIQDLAYYWPHYTPIPAPADEDLMIFTLSKVTGHAGSRFGWAIIKDEAVYKRMLNYVDLTTFGVSKDTQLRVLKLLKVVLSGNGRAMYEFGYNTMKNRWNRLSKALSQSERFSIQKLKPQYCSFSQQIRTPSPAFAWLKCERSILKDRSCYEVLKEVNITGRAGRLFGAGKRYVRLSLVSNEDHFDLLLRQINKVVSMEIDDKLRVVTASLGLKHNESTVLSSGCYRNISLGFRMELETLNSNMFRRQHGLNLPIASCLRLRSQRLVRLRFRPSSVSASSVTNTQCLGVARELLLNFNKAWNFYNYGVIAKRKRDEAHLSPKFVPFVNCFPICQTCLPSNRNMDAQAKKKALFRSKLNAQKKEKRIESPLVRYNEFDQPVCRVCDVVLKSESLWDAHQVSRKHRQAISNLKANAAGSTKHNNAKPVADTNPPKAKSEHSLDSQIKLPEVSREVSKPQSSSVLPPGFFDDINSGKTKSEHLADSDLGRKAGVSAQVLNLEKEKGHFHDNNAAKSNVSQAAMDSGLTSVKTDDTETKQVKGILPEGFFDNKEADLRARGIKPVKPDVKDEYKEFEKLIQEDLKDVDDRLEEEEIDAAEMIEEEEFVEQKILSEKVEMLKKRRLELKAANAAKRGKSSEVVAKGSRQEESSSDDESEENFAVNWRAQHL